MTDWQERKSTKYPFRKYYVKYQYTYVSQWGIPFQEGDIPLPPHWEKHMSRQYNKLYYENLETSQTQWEQPFGKILPFILFEDEPDPYQVIKNLDSKWKYGIFVTPIYPTKVEKNYIETYMQDPYPWGELHISCTEFINMNLEKALECMKQVNDSGSQYPDILGMSIQTNSRGGRQNLILDVDYFPVTKGKVQALFNYFSNSDPKLIKQISGKDKATLQYNVDKDFKIDYKYYNNAMEQIKDMTSWECSLVARLDDDTNNTRSLIFMSAKSGVRSYIRNIK
jgi:hypothetical protein